MNRFTPLLLLLLLLLPGTTFGAVTLEETLVDKGGVTLPEIQGGTDQTYVLFVTSQNHEDVSAVTGGGLTWTEQREQCGTDFDTGVRVWTAQGSPASAFNVGVAYDGSSGNAIAAVLARYSGVTSITGPASENTLLGNCGFAALPSIPGGSDQTYALVIASEKSVDVTGVTGGGLTWIEQKEQCAAKSDTGVRVWTAQGSPGSSFQAAIDFDVEAKTDLAAVLTRYSGVETISDATGENTNGENGACDDGPENKNAALTLTSTDPNSIHLVGIAPKDKTVTVGPTGYTLLGSHLQDKTWVYAYQKAFNPGATDTAQATLEKDKKWATAGVVLAPSAGAITTHETVTTQDSLPKSTAELTLTSTDPNSIHVIGVSPENHSVSSFSGGYSLVASHDNNPAKSYVYDQTFAAPTMDTFQATLDKNAEWATAGVVLSGGTRQEAVAGFGGYLLPEVQGGTDQTYIAALASDKNEDVTSVAGGGLTWVEQKEQCGGKPDSGMRIWTAQGSPGAAFNPAIGYDLGAAKDLASVLSRWSGVGTIQDATGHNTNGENGSCSDGTEDDAAELTLTSSNAGSTHLVALNPEDKDVTTAPADYTERGSHDAGKAASYLYSRAFTCNATDQLTATLSKACDWTTAGVVLRPTQPVDHFVLTHDGFALTCALETITVTAYDSCNVVVSDFAAGITLDTQAGVGTWTSDGGNGGTFDDATASDGLATYTFDATDGGTATFYLDVESHWFSDVDSYITAEPTIRDDDTEGDLATADAQFVWTQSALSDPPPDPIDDPVVDQIAGTGFSPYLTIVGEDPNSGGCAVLSGYTGSQQVKFWIDYVDPSTGTVVATIDGTAIATSHDAASNQTVTFTDGQATPVVKYKDVGDIRLYAEDETHNPPEVFLGGSNAFVVKPADFVISQVSNSSDFANPGVSTPTGTVFTGAGQPLEVTVRVEDSEGSLTPNFGNEGSPEGIDLTFVSLVAPSGGATGALANGSAFSSTTPAGTFENTTVSWSEVGAITLRPDLADDDYLGAGDVTGTVSGTIGRFTPDHFSASANSPQITTQCAAGAFSYIGTDLAFGTYPVVTVTAENAQNGTTTNYTGSWMRMQASDPNASWVAETGTLQPSTAATPDLADLTGGSVSLTYDNDATLGFTRGTPVAPFNAEIALSITLQDQDGVTHAGNPYQVGAPTAGSGMSFSSGKTTRWGRFALSNAYGPETEDLPVPFRTEYYDGTTFVVNTSDTCTAADVGEIGTSPSPVTLSSTPTIANDPVSSGSAGLEMSAPGLGNKGSVDLEFDLSTATGADLEYLLYDWDGDSAYDDNPTSRATFGIYAGDDEMVYMRELY